ncbi:MAG: short-chain dehydrogenase [Myxococcales bacterium SG8_38]|nr:MAG: short-chain dehydrogenase [Myxococcales bacterium SG8_38]
MRQDWSLDRIPDLSGRVMVVTGANSGIGYEAARALARHGAEVVLACRSGEKAEAAAGRIRAESPSASLEIVPLDLADLASIRAFADTLRARKSRLDALINNAGVMALPRRTTRDGFEMQLGTNHLGHFALTGRLLELLLATPRSRVVNVSSMAHTFGTIRFHDLQWERRYSKWGAYGQSKLANLLFTHELDKRLKETGSDTISVACHPGWAATNLQEVGPKMAGSKLMETLSAWGNAMLAQDAAAGALPTVFATVEPLKGNEYVGPTRMMGWHGPPEIVQPLPKARDPETAERLWEVSEDLTGVHYAFD